MDLKTQPLKTFRHRTMRETVNDNAVVPTTWEYQIDGLYQNVKLPSFVIVQGSNRSVPRW